MERQTPSKTHGELLAVNPEAKKLTDDLSSSERVRLVSETERVGLAIKQSQSNATSHEFKE